MGSRYPGDHTATHIRMQQHATLSDYNRISALERSVIDYWGGGVLKLVLPDPNPRPHILQWFETCGLNDGFLALSTRQKQRIVTPGDP